MQLLKRMMLQAITRGVMKVLAVPDWVLRPLVGRPIRVDGNELSATAQLLIKLERIGPRKDPHLVTDVTAARAEFDVAMKAMLPSIGRRVATRDIEFDGADGLLPARIYRPPNATGQGPAMVFFHGGGFVIGSIESHDAICRFLCERSGIRIISVGYRLAPENPFPAAVDDALSAFCQVAERPERYGAKPGLVGVGGDSAGGTLAAVVAHTAVREHLPAPAFNLMLYPATEGTDTHRSRHLFAHGFFVERETIDWYRSMYMPDLEKLADPRVSPLRAPSLVGLPPTCVVTAGFDPFRDEGAEYADRLGDAGVAVTHLRPAGLLHGFAPFLTVDAQARQAMRQAADALRNIAKPSNATSRDAMDQPA